MNCEFYNPDADGFCKIGLDACISNPDDPTNCKVWKENGNKGGTCPQREGGMVRLAIRITNIAAAVHIGGDPEVETFVIEIENSRLAELLKPQQWTTKSISVVRE